MASLLLDVQSDEIPLKEFAFLVDIGLNPTGDSGSNYHLQNDPQDPLQRKNWAERKSAVDIRATCLDVIHGLLDRRNPILCTLLVVEFRFDSRKLGRRVISTDIQLRFSSTGLGSDPEVVRISPVGCISLVSSSKQEVTTIGADASAGIGALVPGDLGAGWRWSKTVSKTVKDASRVVGSMDTVGRTWGKRNSASWTLMENRTTKTGIPSMIRVAVLLCRKDEEPFRCDFTIKAKTDWHTSLRNLLGSTPPDDPVLFDPKLASTKVLQEYDELALGAIDMEALSDISDAAFIDNTI